MPQQNKSPLFDRIHIAPSVPTPPGRLRDAVLRHLSRLPRALRTLWAQHPRGVMAIDASAASAYLAEPTYWRHLHTSGLLLWHVDDVMQRREAFWEVVGAWFDHWLGSDATGAFFSEGACAPFVPEDAARRWQDVLALGYAEDLLGTQEPATLFRRGFARLMVSPRELDIADPQMARWFRTVVLNEGFWRAVQDAGK